MARLRERRCWCHGAASLQCCCRLTSWVAVRQPALSLCNLLAAHLVCCGVFNTECRGMMHLRIHISCSARCAAALDAMMLRTSARSADTLPELMSRTS